MKKILSLFIILATIISLFSLTACGNNFKKYTDYSFDYFDTVTTIVGFEQNEEIFNSKCEKIKEWLLEYHRLYDIYTVYKDVNNLCKINMTQGEIITVEKELTDLLLYSKELYSKTDGNLNIAMGSVLGIWHDYREYGLKNPAKASLPPKDLLEKANAHTDINNLVIDKKANTVLLSDSEMKLDVGGIAKGFAAEEIGKKMIENGISGYILNIGGNVKIVGSRPDGKKWTVGIENPDTEDSDNPYIQQLSLDNMSLVTSGSYQRFYTVNGKNYHHIINPDTLSPAQNFKSVSVLCENSGLADALSTALFCMSYEDGKKLAEQTEGVYVMWVLEDGKKLYSDGFKNFIID